MWQMTNATKAAVIASVNAVLGLVVVFGVPLTNVQLAAIVTAANAILGLYVALTYKNSARRIP